ncbi:MAG: SpoVR family protein [Phycisphaerales bacterium]|nr:SpoVR family protein [Phycisphaerales bacterium]
MPNRPSQTQLPPHLDALREQICAKALDYGLTFFPVVFESVPFDVMNQLAAYGGFPVRYPHWRWGMEYEKLSKRDAYGLGRIYEMVINTDPVYAYLQESNSVTDQKLVMAHVYGHADFFKNNLWFAKTDRKMLDAMANHATRVRRHIDANGHETVEKFIDACHSVEWLIDPHSVYKPAAHTEPPSPAGQSDRFAAKDYLDPFINPRGEMERRQRDRADRAKASAGRLPARPTRDVALFLLRHAPLAPWQQDILGMIREEAYYFAPQAMTKIMNEGWASYWHSMLMTGHFADASEIVCYCQQHAGVLHMPEGNFNPYKIGIELWRDIECRWNTGRHGAAWESLSGLGQKDAFDDGSMQGRDKIFQVRAVYNDAMFIEEFFTPEFCERHRFFVTKPDPEGHAPAPARSFDKVKATLLHHLTNRGEPLVSVVDGNYLNRGELYLTHEFTGLEIDAQRAQRTLANLRTLWDRPVHLQAVIREEMTLLTAAEPDGPVTTQRITDATPKPAHTF